MLSTKQCKLLIKAACVYVSCFLTRRKHFYKRQYEAVLPLLLYLKASLFSFSGLDFVLKVPKLFSWNSIFLKVVLV